MGFWATELHTTTQQCSTSVKIDKWWGFGGVPHIHFSSSDCTLQLGSNRHGCGCRTEASGYTAYETPYRNPSQSTNSQVNECSFRLPCGELYEYRAEVSGRQQRPLDGALPMTRRFGISVPVLPQFTSRSNQVCSTCCSFLSWCTALANSCLLLFLVKVRCVWPSAACPTSVCGWSYAFNIPTSTY